ncbi:hypothetical protein NIES4106_34160 [Fischerella sp. NIES-4106]|nr:hypothetical protein NIES4106_34160 [Fischerella sp. NIES-4106]
MKYTFDIVGVSQVLQFFHHQQETLHISQHQGVEYIATHICTLDAFLESVEPVPSKWNWDKDEVVSTVIDFWVQNSDSIRYWKARLIDAGSDNLLIARVADIKALKVELESLLGRNL